MPPRKSILSTALDANKSQSFTSPLQGLAMPKQPKGVVTTPKSDESLQAPRASKVHTLPAKPGTMEGSQSHPISAVMAKKKPTYEELTDIEPVNAMPKGRRDKKQKNKSKGKNKKTIKKGKANPDPPSDSDHESSSSDSSSDDSSSDDSSSGDSSSDDSSSDDSSSEDSSSGDSSSDSSSNSDETASDSNTSIKPKHKRRHKAHSSRSGKRTHKKPLKHRKRRDDGTALDIMTDDERSKKHKKSSKRHSKRSERKGKESPPKFGTLKYFRMLGKDEGQFAELIKECYFRLLCVTGWFPSVIARTKLAGVAYSDATIIWRKMHDWPEEPVDENGSTNPTDGHLGTADQTNGDRNEDVGDKEANGGKNNSSKIDRDEKDNHSKGHGDKHSKQNKHDKRKRNKRNKRKHNKQNESNTTDEHDKDKTKFTCTYPSFPWSATVSNTYARPFQIER
jgi:hypothetical protein